MPEGALVQDIAGDDPAPEQEYSRVMAPPLVPAPLVSVNVPWLTVTAWLTLLEPAELTAVSETV